MPVRHPAGTPGAATSGQEITPYALNLVCGLTDKRQAGPIAPRTTACQASPHAGHRNAPEMASNPPITNLQCPRCENDIATGRARNGAWARCPHCQAMFLVQTHQPARRNPARIRQAHLRAAALIMTAVVALITVGTVLATLAG